MNLEPYIAFARELAAGSADIILPYYHGAEMGLEFKADASPVTLADRSAERFMRELIEKRFPGHGIVGEEYGTERGGAEFVWVLDPIDGTKSFITHVPLFGTLIGLLHEGRPVVGCIHQPVLNQMMLSDGETTTLNGTPVRIRPCRDLSRATMVTTDPLDPAKHHCGRAFEALQKRVNFSRTWGDCHGYLLVAAGWADLMVDPIMNPWDLLPIEPIMRGAGARMTTWHGEPANHMGANSGIACDDAIHAEVIEILRA